MVFIEKACGVKLFETWGYCKFFKGGSGGGPPPPLARLCVRS